VVTTEQEARFSVQYCIAALLHGGAVRLDAFAPERLADPALHAFMAKVSVGLSPDLADAYPRKRAARIRIELTDGRVLEHEQPFRKGDPEDPLTDAELDSKFRELATPVIGPREAEALLRAIRHGADLPGEVSRPEG
jgi:2-methylcitrate dehydratase PrpD